MPKSDTIERFIKLVNRMDENYKNDTRATGWIMPRELMLALRDELREKVETRCGRCGSVRREGSFEICCM